jgi:hypothetical protein
LLAISEISFYELKKITKETKNELKTRGPGAILLICAILVNK